MLVLEPTFYEVGVLFYYFQKPNTILGVGEGYWTKMISLVFLVV